MKHICFPAIASAVVLILSFGSSLKAQNIANRDLDQPKERGLCFSDSACMPNQHCVKDGSGAGQCVDKPILGECRSNSDCSWPKMCFGWQCR